MPATTTTSASHTAHAPRAAIDIGSNSILLLIVRPRADGTLEVLDEAATVTRLSEGLRATGRLSAPAIARSLACLEGYAGAVAAHGATVQVVTTEAVRAATNPEDFLGPAATTLGCAVQVLSGVQEAQLSYRSVCPRVASAVADAGTSAAAEDRVIDIGGASTELIRGRGGQIIDAVSHALGSVRLTEMVRPADPPSSGDVAAFAAEARRCFASQTMPPAQRLIGLAGTVTSAAAILMGLERYERERVDGAEFSRAEIEGLRDRLAALTLAEREAIAVLGPGRADVAVAGATILLEAMRHCQATTLVVRDRGLRWALVDAVEVGREPVAGH